MGDVVTEPLPVFLFGVARRQPVPGLIEELACQWGTGYAALGVNGLAGCYVSTIGKPHEYFDLTPTVHAASTARL